MERFIDGDGPGQPTFAMTESRPVIAAYVLLTVALLAMWQQGSVEGIGIVAAFILGLTALTSSGASRFKPEDPLISTEIERVIERIELAASVAVEPGSSTDAVEMPPEQVEADRRRAVERLVRDAAVWGWLKANLGSPAPPEPVLEWDRDGNARLIYDDPGALRRQAHARHRPPERARRARGVGGPPNRS